MLELEQLHGAIRTLSDPSALMDRVVEQAMSLIGTAEGAVIGMAAGDELLCLAAGGSLAGQDGTRMPLHQSLCGAAIRSGETLLCHDAATDPRVDAAACALFGAVSAVVVPLLWRSEPVGVLSIIASGAGAFTGDDVFALSRLARFISVTVGSVWDLSQTTCELMENVAHPPATPPAAPSAAGGGRPGDEERIGQFVANVLHPGSVADIAARQRIERVLRGPGLGMRCQPIVRLADGVVIGMEALARFPRPGYPTDEWFSDAERVGLGPELQLAAAERAFALLDEMPPDVYLSVNVGPDIVGSPRLRALIAGVEPGRVVLELTEHLRIEDYEGFDLRLRELRRDGVRLAVDDTGAGFSSLGHIINLEPELIKLDRQLTRGIDAQPKRRALAAALVAFARETGAEVVSEGIETAAELATVRELGIAYGQGYFIGRPTAIHMIPERFSHIEGACGPGRC